MMTEAIVEAGAEALMESSAPGWPSWEDAARVVIEAVAPLLLVEWAMTWDTAGYQCPECKAERPDKGLPHRVGCSKPGLVRTFTRRVPVSDLSEGE